MQSKQRTWNDIKTAVGTQVQMEKQGYGEMSLDQLFLNIKAVGFDSMVCQAEILSDADKEQYQNNGYFVTHTVSEFKEKFSIDPFHIWYTPSLSLGCLYFNPDTLAVCPFHIDMVRERMWVSAEQLEEAVRHREREVAADDYYGSLDCLTDQMRMEYFKKLLEKKGPDIPDLYQMFFSFYRNSDYGFGSLDPDTLSTILKTKTDSDKARTATEIQALPSKVKVFRGGNTASTPYESAYSWSLDINTANFFACRRGKGTGYIVEAEVDKKDVIEAYLQDSAEQEIIVAPEHVRVIHKHEVKGLDFLEPILPVVAPMYHKYKNQMANFEFAQSSSVHGPEHQARVLLLCLIIAHVLDLSQADQKALATAAIYHDMQRVNDDVDPSHGKASRDYYESHVCKPDPLVSFLCEYHCLPDEAGKQEIYRNRQLSKNRSRTQLLYDIFKDADALDRVRFGIRGLDCNQLRLSISKELALVSRICFDQVKVQLQKPLEKSNNLNSVHAAPSQKTYSTTKTSSGTNHDRFKKSSNSFGR